MEPAKGKKGVVAKKIKGVKDLKSLTLDIDIQSLKSAQVVFNLTLVQYFLIMLPSLHFVIFMYILCHYMLG